MMQFNNELLSSFGCSWRCPPLSVRLTGRRADKEAEVGRRLLHASHPTGQWAWKDPRNCALVPFWRRALDVPLIAVTVLRHPVEIATSLAVQREHFARDEALALWERNLRLVLRDCTGLPMLVTRFSDLMADPRAWSAQTSEFLSGQGILLHPDDHALRDFLDAELRHHHEDETLERASGATDEQVALWEISRDLVGVHPNYSVPDLPEESPSTPRLLERNLPSRTRRSATSWYRTMRRYGLAPARRSAPDRPQ